MDDLLTTVEVAALCRVPATTLRYWRHLGDGPPGFKLGKRVLYRREAVEAWLRDREAGDLRRAS